MHVTERTLIWVAGIGTTAVAPLLPHFAHGDGRQFTESYLTGLPLLLSRGLVLALLVLAALVLARQLTAQTARARRPGPRPGRGLALAAALFAAAPVLSALLSGHGGLDPRDLFVPLLFGALYLSPRRPFPDVLRQLRTVLRCYVWGSLLSIVVMPHEWVFRTPTADTTMMRDYLGTGWGQFMGLTSHPNLLGPVMAAALLLELCPLARGRTWPVHALAALTALTLTQSRTAWVGAAAVVFLHGAKDHAVVRRALLTGLAGAAALALLAPPVQATLVRLVTEKVLDDVGVRAMAWRLAYDEFRASPLFGYGPTVFGPAHRTELFGTPDVWIGQAHNQFMQSLAATGLVGAAALCALVVALLLRARRTAAATRGLSTALVALLLVECLAESPLRVPHDLGASVLLLTVIWCVLLHGQPARGDPPASDREAPRPSAVPLTRRSASTPACVRPSSALRPAHPQEMPCPNAVPH